MTNEEAIKVITTLLYNQTGVMGNNQREGVFMAVDALGKQIPKKPSITIFNGYCPDCKEAFGKSNVEEAILYPKYHRYCPMCGQAIDWSEDND